MPPTRRQPPLSALPADVVALEDYARLASEFLAPPVLAWLEGGSGDGQALRSNREAFARHAILPRLLVDTTAGHTRRRLFGRELVHPVLCAPIGYQRLLHPEGECEAARGALDTPFLISTFASCRIADIAAAAAGPCWFQLYWQPERAQTLSLLRAAEEAGCEAIVLTLDVPVKPASRMALRAGFALPESVRAVNVEGFLPKAPVVVPPEESMILRGMMRYAPGPQDLAWLRTMTSLPLLAKGVLHPEDARRLVELGCDGLVVSNHGGRALESAPAALDRLPLIRDAVGPDLPLLLDGGIRSGGDVFKALALGADAVLLGRPLAHGLAVAGALGVAHVLRLLREDLELTLALAGCPRLTDIDRACLVPAFPEPCACSP
ncbi:MAG: alpha-hydroxy-acid oxidizing enzyme [Silanimonas sp.]|nr:MAG: alpha-hydroxy-acid oxidizing enzyme [Silanimonas sp.]GIX39983.1 MAG: alpha-hydroxy-acid oxidizing enzyme [Silanimonas sp.]